MKTWLIAYVCAAVVMLAVDALWLKFVAARMYAQVLGDQLAQPFRPAPAVAFYLIYVFGIVWFAVAPALAAGQWTRALLNGALFGFCAYATFELTNYAVLKSWTLGLTLADLAWGSFLTAVTAVAAYRITVALA